MPGPRKGVRIKNVEGMPRSTGRYISLREPVAMARLGAKQNPARKRRMLRPANEWVRPAPRVNSVPRTSPPMYIGSLPTVSERGPPTTGPRASAKT